MDRLSDIAVFAQVVESGSFTAAARRLSISKPVVSKYVSRLEERLGARLFYRTTRRISLTEVGRSFYERSQKGLREIEEAEAEVSRMQGEPRGTLRINAPLSFGVLHLASALPDFLSRYPELKADVQFDDRKLDVIEGGYDVSIRISEMADSSLVARRIAPCRHVIVAAPDYLQRHGSPKLPTELQSHKIVTYQYQTSSQQWEFVDCTGKSALISLTGTIQMNNSLGVREAVLRGAGIARIPLFAVAGDLHCKRLIRLFPDFRILELSIYVVYPQRRHLSPKVRAFVDFMVGLASQNPDWAA